MSSPGSSRRHSQIVSADCSLALDPSGLPGLSVSKISGSTDEETQFAVARRSQFLNGQDVYSGPIATSLLQSRSLDHAIPSGTILALRGPTEEIQEQLQAEAAQQRECSQVWGMRYIQLTRTQVVLSPSTSILMR